VKKKKEACCASIKSFTSHFPFRRCAQNRLASFRSLTSSCSPPFSSDHLSPSTSSPLRLLCIISALRKSKRSTSPLRWSLAQIPPRSLTNHSHSFTTRQILESPFHSLHSHKTSRSLLTDFIQIIAGQRYNCITARSIDQSP
jgi:hypothetical protein